jgi:Uma2 family endonuclease
MTNDESPRNRVVRWSVDEYERLVENGVLPKRAELIRGLIIERVPKTPLHCALAKWLYDYFMVQLPPGSIVRMLGPLRLADSEPEPDLAVVLGDERSFWEKHPTTAELVVEVAVNSIAFDREKATLYAEAGVKEYWIVLGEEQQIEAYRRPVAGAYLDKLIYRLGDVLRSESVPRIGVPLTELFR